MTPELLMKKVRLLQARVVISNVALMQARNPIEQSVRERITFQLAGAIGKEVPITRVDEPCAWDRQTTFTAEVVALSRDELASLLKEAYAAGQASAK